MRILNERHFTQQRAAFQTSPAFQLFATARHEVKVNTLLAMLDAGWPFDVNEVSPADLGQRSLLLQYLATFDSSLREPTPPARPVEQADLDADEALLRGMGASRTFQEEALRRQYNALQVAMRLLDQGADPWVKDVEGRDVLDQAVALGWLPLVDRLLNDPQAPSVYDLAQRTLWVSHLAHPSSSSAGRSSSGIDLPWLHAAVAYAHHPLLERLLTHGFNINQRDAFGRTSLFYAPFDATAQRVIGHGVNLLAVDDRHQTASEAWPHMVESAVEKRAMQDTIKTALEQRTANDPALLRDQQTRTLFTSAVNDPKAVVVKFMRENGLNVNARRPFDAGEDANLSLLAHVARHAIGDDRRSRAFLSHVLERVEDPWYESVIGLPDAWLALLASTDKIAAGAATYPGLVWQRMDEHYGMDTVEGMGRFLDDGLRFLRAWATPGTPVAWAISRVGLSGVQLWAGLLNDLIARTPEDQCLSSPLRIALTEGEGRRGRGWAWVDTLAGVLHEQRHHEKVVFCMSRLVGLLASPRFPRDGRDANGLPKGPMMALLPVTPAAVHAMLPLITVAPRDRTTLAGVVKGTPMTDWGEQAVTSAEVFQVMQQAMADGVAVDTRCPGFNERLARLQQHQPFLAQKVEQQILRTVARQETGNPGVERSALDGGRRRL